MPERPSAAKCVRSVVLGTVGHIDHGKTSLVLALTGSNTDRLPEEKTRGITIDLGFASFEVPGPSGQQLDVSIVDVPGHHGFIRNMLAGVGGVDAVLLVIAADEGVRAQTREHLQICQMLGVDRGLVVLTKQDAVTGERLASTREEVRALTAGTLLERAPMLAVSARTGQGLKELRATLARLVESLPVREAGKLARFPVDRVFSVRGFGTVVTGTLQSGSFRVGGSIVLQPGSRSVRIRGMEVHGKPVAYAEASGRLAMNVAGIETAQIKRGDCLVPAGTVEPTTVLDTEVQLLPGAPELRHRQQVKVYALTAETQATALLYGRNSLSASTGRHLLRLKLQEPMLLLPGDRFVIRRPSPAETLGGGVVLDSFPLQRQRKTATAAWLSELQEANSAQSIWLRINRRGIKGASVAELTSETGLTAAFLEGLLEAQLKTGTLIRETATRNLLSSQAFTLAETCILRELQQSTQGHSRAELQSRTGLQDWVLAAVTSSLQLKGKLQQKAGLVLATGQVPPTSQGSAENRELAPLERLYRSAGLAPPLVNEAAQKLGLSSVEMRHSATALLRAGKLVRLGSDALLIHKEPLEALILKLRDRRGQPLDVGSFKEQTGLSRKHAIPLLEYLDSQRVTRSSGTKRLIC